MGYLKTLLSKDIIVTPFRVHKQFSYSGTPPGYNSSGVSVFNGENTSYPLGGGEEGTGSTALVYNSIKQLYYSNYLSGSGEISNVATRSINKDGTYNGEVYSPLYINNVQSITESRWFPTASGIDISVLSIPGKQFGENVKPGSYYHSSSGVGVFIDDGEGNLISESVRVGNIFYESGLVVYTGVGGGGGNENFSNPQWESSVTIYETQYKCTIRSSEFNYSMNPSLLTTYGTDSILTSGSATYKDFVTSSDFSPFVTSIGLYDDEQNLLAVAKLAQPLPTSQTTDTTILINLDR